MPTNIFWNELITLFNFNSITTFQQLDMYCKYEVLKIEIPINGVHLTF